MKWKQKTLTPHQAIHQPDLVQAVEATPHSRQITIREKTKRSPESLRVIVPYTNLHPLVSKLLERYGFDPEYVYVGKEWNSYWKLLNEAWAERSSVILIEHDILPWPGAIEELISCPGLWCANSYDQRGIGIFHSFGCVKFSKELMEALPNVWQQVEDRHWSKLDAEFEFIAANSGHRPHHHRPPVIHLHDYNEVAA